MPGEDAKASGKEVKVKVLAKGGQKLGAKNFGHDNTKHLLDILRQEMPLGQTGWNRVADLFNVWAGSLNGAHLH